MVASLLTCSGASVGVSISTQRRMPSRMALLSKGLAGEALDMAVIDRSLAAEGFKYRHSAAHASANHGCAMRAPENRGRRNDDGFSAGRGLPRQQYSQPYRQCCGEAWRRRCG